MKTELQDIVNRLQGYDDDDYYEIINAEKTGGIWHLAVKHIINPKEEPENESNE